MKYLNRALESADLTDVGLVQEIKVSPDQGEQILDIIESEQVQQSTVDELQRAEVAVEALQETYAFLKAAGPKAGYTTQSLAIGHAQAVTKLVGAKIPEIRAVSLEQHENNRELQHQIALESLGTAISNVYERIKAFFVKIYTWIRTKIAAYVNNITKLKKLRDDVNRRLPLSTFKDKVSDSDYLRHVIAYRKGNVLHNLLEDAKAIDYVFEEFMSARARGFATIFENPITSKGLIFVDNRAHDSAVRYTQHAAENIISKLNAKNVADANDHKHSRNLPGFVSLLIRAPEFEEGSKPGFPLVITRSGSITVRRGNEGELGELPTKIDSQFARQALDFVDFTIAAFKSVEDALRTFPTLKDEHVMARHDKAEAQATAGSDGGRKFSYWEYANMLQMYYGVWQTQLMSGMLHTSMGLLKFVNGSMVTAK